MNSIMLIPLVAYATVILVIGWFSSRSQRGTVVNEGDAGGFIVGGRKVGFWATALSAHKADMSDWLLMGFPAALYMKGMPAFWIAITLIIGMYCTWQFVAAQIRRQSEHYGAYTLSSYFEKRFNDRSGLIIIAAALIQLFFFIIYIAAGLKGTGMLLTSLFGIDYHIGAFLGGAFVVSYCLMGGYVAVAWIDCFQALFLLAMLIITPYCALRTLPGGLTDVVNALHNSGLSLSLIPDFSWATIIGTIAGPIAWGLGYFGMPHIISKFMGAKDPAQMHKSKYIGITWQILALTAAASVGLIGVAYFMNSPLAKPEMVFVEMAQHLFSPLFAGFVLFAILAATLSAIDTQMLVVSSIATQDMYQRFINPTATRSQSLKVFRTTIIVSFLAGYACAFNEHTSIMSLVQFAWSGFGASFSPLILMALYSTRINRFGAFAGIVAGGATATLWKLGHFTLYGITVNEMAPAFLASLVSIVLVSALTRKWA